MQTRIKGYAGAWILHGDGLKAGMGIPLHNCCLELRPQVNKKYFAPANCRMTAIT